MVPFVEKQMLMMLMLKVYIYIYILTSRKLIYPMLGKINLSSNMPSGRGCVRSRVRVPEFGVFCEAIGVG